MSRVPRATKTALKILVAILSVIILVFVIEYLRTEQTKNHIDTNYHKLQLPQQLTLQSASWSSGDIDNSAAWTYKYAANAQRRTVFDNLDNDLKASGYSIDFASNETEDYITARNTHNRLYLTIYLSPSPPNSASAAPPLQSVIISAEELPK